MAAADLLVCVCLALCLCQRVVLADVDCVISGNDHCKCSTANLTLDLNQMGLTLPKVHTVADKKYDIYYMPCAPEVCPGASGETSVMCQVRMSNNEVFSLGRYTNFEWTVTQFSPLEFEIHYEGGDASKGTNRKSVVKFKAGTGATVFSYVDEDDTTLTYNFNIIGSRIAPAKRGGGGSSGGIEGPIGLAIIFLALGGFVAYLVIGGIFMYTQRGARGAEIIPNYSFWKDLPFLVMDGFFFVISPCYKRSNYQGL